MSSVPQRFRWLATRLPKADQRRLVVVTGARQTGKTTLARSAYGSLRYLNLDAVELREDLRAVRTAQWAATVGPAVLDEAQKEPTVFDKVKYAYDSGELNFTALLGSSRFLLLDRVRESLAGRAFVFELWPLMASEVRAAAEADPPSAPLLDAVLRAATSVGDVLAAEPPILLGDEDEERRIAIDHLSRWGGMPELLVLDQNDRREWLRSYQQTFLERDLVDLARLADLQPFRRLQKLCMLRSGSILNYANLARDADLSPSTARRYLDYLELSYQVFVLRPHHRNLTSAVVKSPKIYWVDLGLLRQGTRQLGPMTGAMFESLVIGEIHKWIRTTGADVEPSFYRSRSGLEVDLMLETPHGIVGIAVKQAERAHSADARGLRRIAPHCEPRWLGGIVVCNGGRIERIDAATNTWAVPLHRLL